MNKNIVVAFVIVIFAQTLLVLSAIAQPTVQPNEKAILKGLVNITIKTVCTDDAKRTLKSIGQHADSIESEMSAIVKQRLSDAGISNGSGDAQFLISLYTDLMSGTIKIGAALNEPVALVRKPTVRLFVPVWKESADPQSNESKPIRRTVGELVDDFIADYLKANPERKRSQ